jgi:hypothetical protein
MSWAALWKYQIIMICDEIQHIGYHVVSYTDADDHVDFELKTIHINSRNHAENRFYTLLHELGHLIVRDNSDEWIADHPVYVHSHESCEDGRVEKGKAYKVSLISEEIEAWKHGRRFAKGLNLYIDDKKYNKHMTESVMTYIKWAAE